MTVKELTEALQKYDDDSIVMCDGVEITDVGLSTEWGAGFIEVA